ncbi:hypothetical protein T492DRAFT_1126396 [Pavlovales sp. CCMP2436]|nr:hypothetical protein T492DRAFT_1126396 [Pavlovales sp. CCMP2436]
MPQVIIPSTLLLGVGMVAVLNLSWRPFVKGSREVALTLSSAELGSIVHEVRLEAIGAADVRTLQFKFKVSVEIRFEPSRLGEVTDTLTIAHPDGGEYVCNLLGLGSEPGRLGPIVISAGQTVQVPFKNVLNANVEFASTASPAGAFAVGKPRKTIPAKKGSAIAVSFKPEPGTPASTRVDWQLVVIANAPASATGSEGPLQWVVYLRVET